MKNITNQTTPTSLAGIIFILAVLLMPIAASADWAPEYAPQVNLTQTKSDIKIDGHLNEAAWQYAGNSKTFVESYPGDMTEPPVKTEVYITYDNSNLYVGFIAYDNPDDLRATMCQRDQYTSDDYVSVLLDPYGNAAWSYEFHVNPYGIQKDRIFTFVGSTMFQDFGFDLIWKSAAKITSEGYSVEIAIPFASIRFPNRDVQNWKVNFERFHPRETYRVYSWSAFDRNEQCTPCQWGSINGMTDIQPGKGFEVLPAMVGRQAGYRNFTDNTFDNETADGELALTGKYSISSDITLEAALNPDFSQIEADAAQIDVNSPIGLFYPERRPFFQEGIDIFSTLFNSFNTRSILDPQMAVKLTGRTESYRFGLLSAIDETSPYVIPTEEGSVFATLNKSYVNVFRAAKTIGTGINSHNVGILLGDRRFEGGGESSVASLDMTLRLNRNYSIDGQYIYTKTKEPNIEEHYNTTPFDNGKHTVGLDGESYSGFAFITRFNRRSNGWNFTLDYNQVNPAYQTQVGWDPWNNYRNASVGSRYNIYVRKGLLESLTPWTYLARRWNFNDEQKFENLNAGIDARLNWAQTFLSFNFQRNSERWAGRDYDDMKGFNFNISSRPIKEVGFNFSGSFGERASIYTQRKGDQVRLNGTLSLKPLDRLSIYPSYTIVKADEVGGDLELYNQKIFRTKLQLQATRKLSLRLVVQHNDSRGIFLAGNDLIPFGSESWEVDPLITYRISSFSVFYVGSTYDIADVNRDPNRAANWELSERHYFMKLQYLFQI